MTIFRCTSKKCFVIGTLSFAGIYFCVHLIVNGGRDGRLVATDTGKRDLNLVKNSEMQLLQAEVQSLRETVKSLLHEQVG